MRRIRASLLATLGLTATLVATSTALAAGKPGYPDAPTNGLPVEVIVELFVFVP